MMSTINSQNLKLNINLYTEKQKRHILLRVDCYPLISNIYVSQNY